MKNINFITCVFVRQIMQELASNGVEIYRFPVDDETVAEMNASMNVSITSCTFTTLFTYTLNFVFKPQLHK